MIALKIRRYCISYGNRDNFLCQITKVVDTAPGKPRTVSRLNHVGLGFLKFSLILHNSDRKVKHELSPHMHF